MWGQQEAQKETPSECLSPGEQSPAPADPKTPLILPKKQQNSFPWWQGLPFRSRQSILGARSLNSCKKKTKTKKQEFGTREEGRGIPEPE